MNTGRLSKYNVIDNAADLSKPMWLAAKYERISRKDDKEKESNSIESQEKYINFFLKKNIDIKPYDNYVDDEYTGFNFERPNFKRMLADIESGKINCIIVKDLSRFGRDHQLMLDYMMKQIPRMGIRFIAINDDVDSYKKPESMSDDNLRLNLFFNDEYGWTVSENVKAALTARRKKGMFIGSFAPFGYLKDPDNKHKLIIDEPAAEIVKLIYKSFIDGKSILSITRKLNELCVPNPTKYKMNSGLNVSVNCLKKTEGLWSDRTVRRLLENKLYLGHMIQRKMEVPNLKYKKCKAVEKNKQIIVLNTHEPIIDTLTFDSVQNLLKRDTRISPTTKEISIFAGYIKCADCKRAMVKRTVTQPYKTYHYYNCATYRRLHECTKHAIQIEDIENVVLSSLKSLAEKAVKWEQLVDIINCSPSRDSTSIRLLNAIADLERLKEKKLSYDKNLYKDYVNKMFSLDLFLEYKSEVEEEIKEINKRIEIAQNELNEYKSGVSGTESFISNFKKYKNITELNRNIIVDLIEMIWVHENGLVTIDFNFSNSYNRTKEYLKNNQNLLEYNDTTAEANKLKHLAV